MAKLPSRRLGISRLPNQPEKRLAQSGGPNPVPPPAREPRFALSRVEGPLILSFSNDAHTNLLLSLEQKKNRKFPILLLQFGPKRSRPAAALRLPAIASSDGSANQTFTSLENPILQPWRAQQLQTFLTMIATRKEAAVEIDVNGAAQIIAAALGGTSVLLRALAVFLPVWRNRSPTPPPPLV